MSVPPTAGRPHWLPFLGIAAAVVVVDQATKAWIVANLAPGHSTAVIGDWLRLVHGQNTGALFGFFRDSAVGFAFLSIAVAVAIVWYQARAGGSGYLTLTLALLLGGALGNLIDRLHLGYVVDFVDAGIGSIRFWTFNVADACISASIVLLLAAGLWPSLTTLGQARSDA